VTTIRRDGGLRCGATRCQIEPAVTSARIPWIATVTCVVCGRPTEIRYGDPAATFRVGRELVGVVCPQCLTPEARAELARRQERVTEAR